MNDFYKLNNTIKNYDWGSTEWIPRLIGSKNPSKKPWAELWMGVHPQGTSAITLQDKSVPLSNITSLPFMVKFLAAEKPLSIQAHPNAKQARQGFIKENNAGIAPDARERNYRDANHKPEIICALAPFTAMAGFRETAETEQLLSLLPNADKLQTALKSGFKSFLSTLFNLNAKELAALCNTVFAMAKKSPLPDPLHLCVEFAKQYPNDPGIFSPLYLNVLTLQPFEAVFLPAGILHSYIHGLGLECMANSDNVLRGGLTSKYVDTKELFSILDFNPYKPVPQKPRLTSSGLFRYAVPCKEFSLYVIKTTGNRANNAPRTIALKEKGDAIIAVAEGTAECFLQKGGIVKKRISLLRGESAFADKRKMGETLSFAGEGVLFAVISKKSGLI
jgi:mannose-6-phosphate isomerase